MFVYGDYGQFTFDSMIWTDSIYNLEYDNIEYQMEKLNYESRESLRVFDNDKCIDDMFEWMKEQLESYYYLEENEVEKVLKLFNSDTWNKVDEIEIEEFCDENDLLEIENIIDFTRECCRNAEEYEWISFLKVIIIVCMIWEMKYMKAGYGMLVSAFIRDILSVCMRCRFVGRS